MTMENRKHPMTGKSKATDGALDVAALTVARDAIRNKCLEYFEKTWDYTVSEMFAAAAIRAYLAALPPPTGAVDQPVACDSPEEWELEMRAFHGANCEEWPTEARTLIADLWRQYCFAAALAAPLQVAEDVAELVGLLRDCDAEESPHYANAHMRRASAELLSLRRKVEETEAALEAVVPQLREETARRRAAERKVEEQRRALERLANAKALQGVRELVAGWNGEGREDGPYERHRDELGATLPATDCGAVYELDEALSTARALAGDRP